MRGWLLDTNVVSELRKSRPNSAVSEFVAAQLGEVLFTTEVTLVKSGSGSNNLKTQVVARIFTCGLTGPCDRFFWGASSRSPKTSSFAGRRWQSKDKSAATPLGNQTCSLQLSQRWKTSSSSRAIRANLLPPGFPYSIHGRASCTCAAKRCELHHPHQVHTVAGLVLQAWLTICPDGSAGVLLVVAVTRALLPPSR